MFRPRLLPRPPIRSSPKGAENHRFSALPRHSASQLRGALVTRIGDFSGLGAAVLVGWLAAVSPAAGSGALSVEGAWARASIGDSKVSAVYLVVTNRGEAADRLVGAAADRAGHTMIHRSVVEDGVMKMRRVESVEIPPGESVRLDPGGLHVMLRGVSSRLETGESISVTLVFERAGELALSVPVRRSPPG